MTTENGWDRHKHKQIVDWLMSRYGKVAIGVVVVFLIAILMPGLTTIVRVPPGYIGIVYNRLGDDLPAGQILAKSGQKGVREKFLTPGWHVVNPNRTGESRGHSSGKRSRSDRSRRIGRRIWRWQSFCHV